MRAFPLLLLLLVTSVSCANDSGAARQAPEHLRYCGELDGVEPVEPVIVGEDAVGCPVFAPVPCTKSIGEYEQVCGLDCGPYTGTSPEGDSWLVGCARKPGFVGCGGPDLSLDLCGIDPFEGRELWFHITECQWPFAYFWDCWESCDGSRTPTGEACL